MVDKNSEEISIIEQCKLLEVSRSTFYYKPIPERKSELDLMAKIDEKQRGCPCFWDSLLRRIVTS